MQWFCSLPTHSIDLFYKLSNVFVQHFYNNIGTQITLANLMHCKQEVKEKLTDFIGRYKKLHSQFFYLVPDGDDQIIFINNL